MNDQSEALAGTFLPAAKELPAKNNAPNLRCKESEEALCRFNITENPEGNTTTTIATVSYLLPTDFSGEKNWNTVTAPALAGSLISSIEKVLGASEEDEIPPHTESALFTAEEAKGYIDGKFYNIIMNPANTRRSTRVLTVDFHGKKFEHNADEIMGRFLTELNRQSITPVVAPALSLEAPR